MQHTICAKADEIEAFWDSWIVGVQCERWCQMGTWVDEKKDIYILGYRNCVTREE
jgi:hypothetical protein